MSDDLITSAVTFLQDPKVADAPLAKRIAFLESKGLSPEQVQVALQRAQAATESNNRNDGLASESQFRSTYSPSLPSNKYPVYRPVLANAPRPQRDWRDWFIMAIASGGFSWTLFFLLKRFVIPLLSPPTVSQLEADKAIVSAQFDQIQEMLTILQKDSEESKSRDATQGERVEIALQEIDVVVQDMKDKTSRREVDIRRLGLEMDQIREMIPKAIEAVKSAQNDALSDLNGELRSLKTLLQNRIKAAAPQSTTQTASAQSSSGGPPAMSTQSTNTGTNVESSQGSASGATVGKNVIDPLSRLTGRASAGIPEWQKSVPVTTTPAEGAKLAGGTDPSK